MTPLKGNPPDKQRIVIETADGEREYVVPCSAYDVLVAELNEMIPEIRHDLDTLGIRFDAYTRDHDIRHREEVKELRDITTAMARQWEKDLKEIMDAIKNRLPLWATLAFAATGGIIGSALTVIAILMASR